MSNAVSLCFETVALQARCDHSVIERPDGTTMVHERVVVVCLFREGAYSPGCEHIGLHQALTYLLCLLFVNNSAPEQVSWIGWDNGYRPFLAIQRNGGKLL